MGARVILASDGSALHLLKAEFPQLTAVQLPSYRIRYQTSSMVWNIAWQLPRMLRAIRAEHRVTARLVHEHKIDGIISDNRYGCFNALVPSVLLTHQIHLKVPNAALEWGANQVLRRAFQKFDEIWIPDEPGEINLSEALSHPPLRDFSTQYLGLLSRFTGNEAPSPVSREPSPINREPSTFPKVAVVLSGPEPQRTILEQILMEQALSLPYKFVFVKGKTRALEHHFVSELIEVISYLGSGELNDLIRSSDVVICRSGYSSLMDLAVLGSKKAILIPTPGQTEQEYLGKRLAAKGCFVCQKQAEINLETALEAVGATTGFLEGQYQAERYKPVLAGWLDSLQLG
jgi:UDP-N-acetylglucosamine transferase subunit ALG13